MRFLATTLLVLAIGAGALADDWDTYYERSGKLRTPDYATTVEYCRRLADASPWVHYTTYGTSPQGRPLPLLIVNRNGNFDVESVRKTDDAVYLIQAGIHSGEIDGKDAGLMLIRDIAIRKTLEHLIDHVTILFMPIFSVDAHERFGPNNRVNQNGPEEMGWRVTAQGYNLNRDYLKADAPEMRAWLGLYREWLPEFFTDCHVTDGADYQYTVTYALEVFGNMDKGLTEWTRDRYLARIKPMMNEAGFPIIRYAEFRKRHDPKSGLTSWAAPPRFSEGYTAIQNRPGLLIETHMLKSYEARVTGTYEMLKASTEVLNKEHKTLRKLCREADKRSASPSFREAAFPLNFTMGPDSVMVDFLGVEYDIVKSDITGGDWEQYSSKKTTMRIPYFNTQVPTERAMLPDAYVIPPEWDFVADRLDLHGVRYTRLAEAKTIPVKTYRFEDVKWRQDPYEGHHPLTYTLKDSDEERTFPAGSIVVDMNQRTSRVAAHLLEPAGPDALVRWGYFDTIFEQKEYIESYVAEELARKMLAEDPALGEAFAKAKAEDPEFAKNPGSIRAWFYQHSKYWDDRINAYPVGRVFDHAVAAALH